MKKRGRLKNLENPKQLGIGQTHELKTDEEEAKTELTTGISRRTIKRDFASFRSVRVNLETASPREGQEYTSRLLKEAATPFQERMENDRERFCRLLADRGCPRDPIAPKGMVFQIDDAGNWSIVKDGPRRRTKKLILARSTFFDDLLKTAFGARAFDDLMLAIRIVRLIDESRDPEIAADHRDTSLVDLGIALCQYTLLSAKSLQSVRQNEGNRGIGWANDVAEAMLIEDSSATLKTLKDRFGKGIEKAGKISLPYGRTIKVYQQGGHFLVDTRNIDGDIEAEFAKPVAFRSMEKKLADARKRLGIEKTKNT